MLTLDRKESHSKTNEHSSLFYFRMGNTKTNLNITCKNGLILHFLIQTALQLSVPLKLAMNFYGKI